MCSLFDSILFSEAESSVRSLKQLVSLLLFFVISFVKCDSIKFVFVLEIRYAPWLINLCIQFDVLMTRRESVTLLESVA